MNFATPKSISIEDVKGMTVTRIGETSEGTFIIEFDKAYRLIIPVGTIIRWQRRQEN